MKAEQLTATLIAHCGGMSAARRLAWSKHGLRPQPPFSEFDAIETAVARVLAEQTNQKRATAAFRELQPRLRKAIVAGRTQLWAIVPVIGRDVALESSAGKALKIAVATDGPLWVVALKPGIEAAKKRYAQYAPLTGSSDTAVVRPLSAESAMKLS